MLDLAPNGDVVQGQAAFHFRGLNYKTGREFIFIGGPDLSELQTGLAAVVNPSAATLFKRNSSTSVRPSVAAGVS